MKNHEPVSPDTLELLFAHRNKAYGAYQLRRNYNQTLAKSVGIGLLLLVAGLVLPHLLSAVNVSTDDMERNVVIDMSKIKVESTPPPPVLPPPAPASPPVQASQRFVPPTPTPDDQVKDENPPTVADVLDNKAIIGKSDHEGEIEVEPTLNFPKELPTTIEAPKEDPDVVMGQFDVQKPASFPGGEKELFKYLAENLHYPTRAREVGLQGTVALSFVVNKDGSISEVTILKDAVGAGCGKEAQRVIANMPKWTPGEANGRAVRVRFTIPVKFALN